MADHTYVSGETVAISGSRAFVKEDTEVSGFGIFMKAEVVRRNAQMMGLSRFVARPAGRELIILDTLAHIGSTFIRCRRDLETFSALRGSTR